MKLFLKSSDNKLFTNFKKQAIDGDMSNQKIIVKIFNPYGDGTWYVVNSDPDDPDYLYGIVVLHGNVEVGSFSRKELESLKAGKFKMPLEREFSWSPINAEVLLKHLRKNQYQDWIDDDLEPTNSTSSKSIPFSESGLSEEYDIMALTSKITPDYLLDGMYNGELDLFQYRNNGALDEIKTGKELQTLIENGATIVKKKTSKKSNNKVNDILESIKREANIRHNRYEDGKDDAYYPNWNSLVESEEKLKPIKQGIEFCLDAKVPPNVIIRFALGTKVLIAYQPNNEAGYGNPIFQYRPDFILRKFEHLAVQYNENFYESGFKHLQIDPKELEALGYKMIGVESFDGEMPDGKSYTSSFDVWISSDKQTVITFQEGRTGDGGYSSLYSEGFEKGFERTQDVLIKANYVKEVDWFENGYGSIDINEARQLLEKSKQAKMTVVKEASKIPLSEAEAQKMIAEMQELSERLASLKQRFDERSMESGGIIKFSDGFKFNEVSKDYAVKNWKSEAIFGINLTEETEHLVENESDLNDYDVFGTEEGFKKGGKIEKPIYVVMKRKTSESPYKYVSEELMTESEADEFVKYYKAKEPQNFAVEKHIDLPFEKGGMITTDQYHKALSDYDKYTALWSDAKEEGNQSEMDRLKPLIDSTELIVHRYERNYAQGGDLQDLDIANSDLFAKGGSNPELIKTFGELVYLAKKHNTGEKFYEKLRGVKIEDSLSQRWQKKYMTDKNGEIRTPAQASQAFVNDVNDNLFTLDNYIKNARFYTSGKIKNVKYPTGKKAILKNDSTEKTFRNESREFMEKSYHKEFPKNYAQGGDLQDLDIANSDLFKDGGVIEFSDGFKFNQVSKDYAVKNWKSESIFGINTDEESEGLIESESDLNDYDTFGTEEGFKSGGMLDKGDYAIISKFDIKNQKPLYFVAVKGISKPQAYELKTKFKKTISTGWKVVGKDQISNLDLMPDFDIKKPLTEAETRYLDMTQNEVASEVYNKGSEKWKEAIQRASAIKKGAQIRNLVKNIK